MRFAVIKDGVVINVIEAKKDHIQRCVFEGQFDFGIASDGLNIGDIVENYIDPDTIKAELADLDAVLPRCVEDLIGVTVKDETILPEVVQQRLKRKRELRKQLKGGN